MATFTMYLHELLGADSPDDADYTLIGLDKYPIWDEGYRSELNHKIMMRFWNREIGAETPFEFVHNVRRVMGEIMPYYNKLAETTMLDFDPFETINITDTSSADSSTDGESFQDDQRTDESTSKGQESSKATQASEETTASDSKQQAESASRSVAYEHPQTQLSTAEDYATSSQESKTGSTSDTQSTGEGQSTVETSSSGDQSSDSTVTSDGEARSINSNTSKSQSTSAQHGFQGDRSALLQAYRDTIMGVDTQILDELEVVFMGIYDNGDTYTTVEGYSPHPWILW